MLYLRNGRYSPQLMKADADSIQALYRANGFNKATISTAIEGHGHVEVGKKLKVAEIEVVVTIDGGAAAEVRHGDADRRGRQPA